MLLILLYQMTKKWKLNGLHTVILHLLNKLNYIFPKLFLNLPNLPKNGKIMLLTTPYCVKILKLLMKFFTELLLNITLSMKRNNRLPLFLRLKEKFSKKVLLLQLKLLHLLKHLQIKLLKLLLWIKLQIAQLVLLQLHNQLLQLPLQLQLPLPLLLVPLECYKHLLLTLLPLLQLLLVILPLLVFQLLFILTLTLLVIVLSKFKSLSIPLILYHKKLLITSLLTLFNLRFTVKTPLVHLLFLMLGILLLWLLTFQRL